MFCGVLLRGVGLGQQAACLPACLPACEIDVVSAAADEGNAGCFFFNVARGRGRGVVHKRRPIRSRIPGSSEYNYYSRQDCGTKKCWYNIYLVLLPVFMDIVACGQNGWWFR